MKLRVATSLDEYISIINEAENKVLWYRGMSKSSYYLTPSLFREKRIIGLEFSGREINGKFYKKSDAIMKSDLAAIDTFINYYQKFFPDKCKDFNLVDYLYIMQHYEIPTRLLDFSTNKLIALYFSVATANKTGYNIDKEIEDFNANEGFSELGSSIHIIDPAFTNNQTNRFVNLKEDILNIDDINIDVLSQIISPICVKSTNKDPRIINQEGVFMLFGSDYRSYDEYQIFAENTTKIFIPNSCRLAIKEELRQKHSITHSFVYPDIKGISLEIIDEIEEKYHSDCLSVFGK
ncbi:FRG domain-containing protein [Riemerella anatipestifer]|uniref:FRG domain-containing protein n=1 Tax=Riemerella anatipestifer TaxID=34085 RepID=UPI001374C15D|nr:FRG domain-containing protein [Riemerella anatipestifer]